MKQKTPSCNILQSLSFHQFFRGAFIITQASVHNYTFSMQSHVIPIVYPRGQYSLSPLDMWQQWLEKGMANLQNSKLSIQSQTAQYHDPLDTSHKSQENHIISSCCKLPPKSHHGQMKAECLLTQNECLRLVSIFPLPDMHRLMLSQSTGSNKHSLLLFHWPSLNEFSDGISFSFLDLYRWQKNAFDWETEVLSWVITTLLVRSSFMEPSFFYFPSARAVLQIDNPPLRERSIKRLISASWTPFCSLKAPQTLSKSALLGPGQSAPAPLLQSKHLSALTLRALCHGAITTALAPPKGCERSAIAL